MIILILALVGGGYYFFFQREEWGFYRDDTNRVSFEKPEGWMAGSVEGYTRVAEDTSDLTKPSVLIKTSYPESIIPALGLDRGEEVVVGGKTMRRADHEWETKTPEGVVTGTQTFTFFLWETSNGQKIIFEITPWQRPSVSGEVERIVRTFNPNE